MATEFDFIIIGGGTSGLVVASRLSEDPGVRVLVLETGANHIEDPRVKIPALFEALKGTEVDWGFESQAQVSCAVLAALGVYADLSYRNNSKEDGLITLKAVLSAGLVQSTPKSLCRLPRLLLTPGSIWEIPVGIGMP
jgi:choline dehydrogenase-like flavoprotein